MLKTYVRDRKFRTATEVWDTSKGMYARSGKTFERGDRAVSKSFAPVWRASDKTKSGRVKSDLVRVLPPVWPLLNASLM